MINTISNNFTVKKIFAFEPNPECLNTLKKIKKNNLEIFEFALGNKKGYVRFKYWIYFLDVINKRY